MQASIAFSLPRLVTDPPGLGFHEAIFSICKAASHMRAALDVYDPSALDALGEITIELPPAIYHWARMAHHGDTGRSVLEFMAANFPSLRFTRGPDKATIADMCELLEFKRKEIANLRAGVAAENELHDILYRLGKAAAEARGVRFNGSIMGEDGVEQDITECIAAKVRERKASTLPK